MAQGAVKPSKKAAPKKCVYLFAPRSPPNILTILLQADRPSARQPRNQAEEAEPPLTSKTQEEGNQPADGENGEAAGGEGGAFGSAARWEERGKDRWNEGQQGGKEMRW